MSRRGLGAAGSLRQRDTVRAACARCAGMKNRPPEGSSGGRFLFLQRRGQLKCPSFAANRRAHWARSAACSGAQSVGSAASTARAASRASLTAAMFVPRSAMFLLRKYMSREEQSPYLFPILHSDEGSPMAYREYQLALRNFNYQLELVGKLLGLKDRLSSYTARHTWATTAYYCEIHPGIISEAMGHSSITVTETYLKPFRSKKIDEANKQVLDFVKRSVMGVSA